MARRCCTALLSRLLLFFCIFITLAPAANDIDVDYTEEDYTLPPHAQRKKQIVEMKHPEETRPREPCTFLYAHKTVD
jgi:hypothetical protein